MECGPITAKLTDFANSHCAILPAFFTLSSPCLRPAPNIPGLSISAPAFRPSHLTGRPLTGLLSTYGTVIGVLAQIEVSTLAKWRAEIKAQVDIYLSMPDFSPVPPLWPIICKKGQRRSANLGKVFPQFAPGFLSEVARTSAKKREKIIESSAILILDKGPGRS